MTRARFVGFLTAILLATGSVPASACSCMDSGPACQAYWRTAAVFDATVDSVTLASSKAGSDPREPQNFVQVTVLQSWKGNVATGPLTILTNADGSMCGYPFTPGHRYLIFASDRSAGGHFEVSLCSATHEYAGTGDDAQFLASLSEPSHGGRIFGAVAASATPFGADHLSRRPIDVRVMLSGTGLKRSMLARDGKFEFNGVPPATYGLHVEPPPGFVDSGRTQTIEIPDPRACARENFIMSRAGRISGHVIGADGRPVAQTEIDLADSTVTALSIISRFTLTDGSFEFVDLPRGDYVLGVNLRDAPPRRTPYPKTIYPGRGPGHVIRISDGAVDIGAWRLPPTIR